jgi:hypothetical protein
MLEKGYDDHCRLYLLFSFAPAERLVDVCRIKVDHLPYFAIRDSALVSEFSKGGARYIQFTLDLPACQPGAKVGVDGRLYQGLNHFPGVTGKLAFQ